MPNKWIALCLFLGFLQLSQAEISATIDELLAQGKPYQALENLERYVKKNPNDFKARGKLFELFLNIGLLNKAQAELQGLLKFERSLEHLLFQARFFIEKDELAQAEKSCLEILSRDKRHIDAKLLLASIYEKRNHTTSAMRLYHEISLIHPRKRDFLRQYSAFLVEQEDYEEAQELLASFKKIYPEDPEYFYSQARLYAKKNQAKQALKYVNRALYYAPANKDYHRLKRELLFKLRDLKTLIEYEKKTLKDDGSAERYFHLAYVHYLSAKKADGSLPDKQYNQINFWPPLLKSIELRENWEVSRFFAEEIAINHYPSADKVRKELAPYHLQRANRYLDTGQYERAYVECVRLLELEPYHLQHRRLFARYHRDADHPTSYLEQLEIIRELGPESDFDLDARIEKLTFKQKGRLANQFSISQFDRDWQRKRLLVMLPLSVERKNTDALEWIVEKMLRFRLRLQNHFTALFSQSSSLKKEIEAQNADFYVLLQLREYPYGIKIQLRLHDAKTYLLVKEESFYAEGNDCYFEIIFPLIALLKEAIPLQGEIIAIKDKRILIDLGERHLVDKTSKFELTLDDVPAGKARVVNTDEWIAEIELDNPSLYNRIKTKDKVVLSREPAK